MAEPTKILLPPYMSALPKEDLFVAQHMQRKNIALAAGYHRLTDSIMVVTEKASVFETAAEPFFGRRLDIITARPINMGMRIEIRTLESFIEVDTLDVLTASKSLELSDFEVSISHEDRNA